MLCQFFLITIINFVFDGLIASFPGQIFHSSVVSNTDHLPTASTCMHLLKLPMFPDLETMTDKLIYAISSGAGFELS